MRERNLFYTFARFVVRLGLRLWLRLESHGAKHVPAEGGCLLASNHASYLDPPIIGCGLPHRIVRFMARDTLFRSRLARWFMNRVECVPIDRTRGDVAALRKGIQVLRSGGVLAVFPEGTRTRDGRLQPPKGGMGFLIAKAGVPVVPVYIDGSFRACPKGSIWVKPVKVRVYYGPPIQPAELLKYGTTKDAYQAIAELVMSRIAALNPEHSAVTPPAPVEEKATRSA